MYAASSPMNFCLQKSENHAGESSRGVENMQHTAVARSAMRIALNVYFFSFFMLMGVLGISVPAVKTCVVFLSEIGVVLVAAYDVACFL